MINIKAVKDILVKNKKAIGIGLVAGISSVIAVKATIKAVDKIKVIKAEATTRDEQIESVHNLAQNDELPEGVTYTEEDYESDLIISKSKTVGQTILVTATPVVVSAVSIFTSYKLYRELDIDMRRVIDYIKRDICHNDKSKYALLIGTSASTCISLALIIRKIRARHKGKVNYEYKKMMGEFRRFELIEKELCM